MDTCPTNKHEHRAGIIGKSRIEQKDTIEGKRGDLMHNPIQIDARDGNTEAQRPQSKRKHLTEVFFRFNHRHTSARRRSLIAILFLLHCVLCASVFNPPLFHHHDQHRFTVTKQFPTVIHGLNSSGRFRHWKSPRHFQIHIASMTEQNTESSYGI